MIRDFTRAISQIFDPRFLGVLLKSLALMVGLLVLAGWAVVSAVGLIGDSAIPLPFTDATFNGLDEMAWFAALGLYLILSIFLIYPVTALFIGLFLDEIADAVETRWHPHLPPPRRQTFLSTLMQGVKFAGVLILANLLALIVYIVATVLAPFAFWAVNGYLLGREYLEVVALRRMEEAEAKAFRRKHFFAMWTAGAVVAIGLSVPILNLFAPLIGVAAFVHLFHRKRAAAKV